MQCCLVWALCAVLQDALDDSQGDGGVQLDPAQLAEYRQLKTQADDKARGLLQEKTGLEAQLKVGLGLCRQNALLFLCFVPPSCCECPVCCWQSLALPRLWA